MLVPKETHSEANQPSPYTCRFPFCHGGTPRHHPFKLFGIFHVLNHPAIQWEFQDPKLEVRTIYMAYVRPIFSGLNFREYPHKIWPKIWYSQYLHQLDPEIENGHL